MIKRDPAEAAEKTYDVIIVGGGIYGVALAREAAARGLRPLLLERDDFGGATSYNSLRIVHGGFRYLQKMDLHRFFESVGERRWLLQHFPELVKPLPCLMPLYGNGLFRPSILRTALMINDILSLHRNRSVPRENNLPGGNVIPPARVKEFFPMVDGRGLKGGAIWYDASMPDSQRLLMEMLRWAVSLGATAVNYMEVTELLTAGSAVSGVAAMDHAGGGEYQFHAPVVVNTAGPWCRQLATRFHQDYPKLFHSSIAWNLLFDHPPLSDYALALAPKKPDAQVYFLRSWNGYLLAGTIHQPWNGVEKQPLPSEASIENFIRDINDTVPGLNLRREDILHIFSGLLPARTEGTNQLAVREVILDHGKSGGPKGLYSVSGVKFTTARLVAEKVVTTINPGAAKKNREHRPRQPIRGLFNLNSQMQELPREWIEELQRIIREEAVVHLDDLIVRRTNLGNLPRLAVTLAPQVARLFDWDEQRCQQEIERVEKFYQETTPINGEKINC